MQDLALGQPMSSDLVVTHVDVDGMVAAAGILRTIPDDAGLRLTSYRLLPAVLASLAGSDSLPRRVWVADLSIEARDLDRALDALDTLTGRGTHFHWFDHHSWNDRAFAEVARRCVTFDVVPGMGRPATLVVCDVLGPGDVFCRLAREIVTERGEARDPAAATWFRALTCLMVERDWPAMHRAVRRLSRLEPLTPDEMTLMNSLPDAHESAVVGDRLRVGVTRNGSRYGVIDLRGAKARLDAVRSVCRQHDLDLVVTIPRECELLIDEIGRRPKTARTDLARLAGLECLKPVAHVCPNMNPIPVELASHAAGAAHDDAVSDVIAWIDSNV